MELWIRSQSKKSLIDGKNLTIIERNKQWIICKLNSSLDLGSRIDLGIYKTEERALEVLDEIQERMINNSLINRKIYADNFKKVYDLKSDELKPYITEIYEMPKE